MTSTPVAALRLAWARISGSVSLCCFCGRSTGAAMDQDEDGIGGGAEDTFTGQFKLGKVSGSAGGGREVGYYLAASCNRGECGRRFAVHGFHRRVCERTLAEHSPIHQPR